MNPRVSDSIREYYSVMDSPKIQKLTARTKEDAAKLHVSLSAAFPAVSKPIVTDYGKCVEIRAYFDRQAPELGSGWQIVRDYILRNGQPWWILSIFLSWVGPYAAVHLGSSSIGPGGQLIDNQASKDLEKTRSEEHVRMEIRSLGYEVLTEADLATPIAVDPKRMRELDGTYVPPTTVGRCLFYPWWGPDLWVAVR